mgnify:CR=1 FL=1
MPRRELQVIRGVIQRHYPDEEKIRVVLEGLWSEDTITELFRREGINSNVYYRKKEFLEAVKNSYLVIQLVNRLPEKPNIKVTVA